MQAFYFQAIKKHSYETARNTADRHVTQRGRDVGINFAFYIHG